MLLGRLASVLIGQRVWTEDQSRVGMNMAESVPT